MAWVGPSSTIADNLLWATAVQPDSKRHFDTFEVKEAGPMANTTVQFVLGASGEVASLRMLDQEFRKQPAGVSARNRLKQAV
jgi:hypothetical protein